MAHVIAALAGPHRPSRLLALPGGCLRVLVLMLGALLPCLAAAQDNAAVLERRVKAAQLYRFINYVEWPAAAFAQPDAPFVVGVAGADALADELSEFAAGRTVVNRPLVVRKIRQVDMAKDVQVLFVARTETPAFDSYLRAAPANALIVTDNDTGLALGSVINFVIVEGQVRFEVSLEAARRRNIRLSSRLLSVAYSVLGVPY